MSRSAPWAPSNRILLPLASRRLVQQVPDRGWRKGRTLGATSRSSGWSAGRRGRSARAPARGSRSALWCTSSLVDAPRLERRGHRPDRPPASRGGRPCPRRRARCPGLWCRSCWRRVPAASRGPGRGAVQRQDQTGVFGNHQALDGLRCSDPAPRSGSISSSSAQGSSTTPLPMTESFPGRTTPEGRSEQLVDLVHRSPACGRRCGRPGTARSRRRAPRASRRSCPCPRRPTGRRQPPHWPWPTPRKTRAGIAAGTGTRNREIGRFTPGSGDAMQSPITEDIPWASSYAGPRRSCCWR